MSGAWPSWGSPWPLSLPASFPSPRASMAPWFAASIANPAQSGPGAYRVRVSSCPPRASSSRWPPGPPPRAWPAPPWAWAGGHGSSLAPLAPSTSLARSQPRSRPSWQKLSSPWASLPPPPVPPWVRLTAPRPPLNRLPRPSLWRGPSPWGSPCPGNNKRTGHHCRGPPRLRHTASFPAAVGPSVKGTNGFTVTAFKIRRRVMAVRSHSASCTRALRGNHRRPLSCGGIPHLGLLVFLQPNI